MKTIKQQIFMTTLNETVVKTTQTLGEMRVRTEFNPSNQDYVSQIKQKTAELINLIDQAAANPSWYDETFGEWKRLKALAMTDYENAGMWAVKAATI